MPERYIVGTAGTAGGSKGWLRVRLEPSGRIESVTEHLRVDVTQSTTDRDYFTFLEGPYRGEKASVVRPAASLSHLGTTRPAYKGPADLRFNLSKGVVSWLTDKLNATTSVQAPTPLGLHTLQLPDFPHGLGSGYLARTPYALHWFYLGHGRAPRGSNDRYLHTGTISAGCATVTDVAGWSRLYEYLILCRGSDTTVGTIHVEA